MRHIQKRTYKYSGSLKEFGLSKTLVEKWLLQNDVLTVEIEDKKVFCYQHKNHSDYSIFIHGWLEGYITSEALTDFLKDLYFWVEYSLKEFLEMIQND